MVGTTLEEKSGLDFELEEVLNGDRYIGTPRVKEVTETMDSEPGDVDAVCTTVYWVGHGGLTSSIGHWIRHVAEKIKFSKLDSWPFNPMKGYVVKVAAADNPAHHYVYFGLRVKRAEGNEEVYLCGGATDFSGEGGHGRKIAMRFLERLGVPIQEAGGDWLINLLTE